MNRGAVPPIVQRILIFLAASGSWALLMWSTACWMPKGLDVLRPPEMRFWEDLALATSQHFAEPARPEPLAIASWRGQAQADAYQTRVLRQVSELGLAPWQFWRTIPMNRFRGYERLEARSSDDVGRAGLLVIGFRMLGGVAPYLLFWLGALISLPLLLWAGWELLGAGMPVAAVLFPLAVTCSAFTADALALYHRSSGFYLLGLLALVPLATYAAAGRPTLRGLAVRALTVGAAIAVCTWCRSAAKAELAGGFLALLVGVARAEHAARGPLGTWLKTPLRRAGSAALLAVLLVAPCVASRPANAHEVWLPIWEGLGDFDRSKGHYWKDSAAKEVLRQAGIDAPPNYRIPTEHDEVFRRSVLADIQGDPLWYVDILQKRVRATLLLSRLWPQYAATAQPSPHEGYMDHYYASIATANVFGLGPWRRTFHMGLLLLPTGLLLVVWCAGRVLPRLRPVAAALTGPVLALACLAAGGLPVPVLITTAGGVEPQSLVLVHLLALAFLANACAAEWKRRSPQKNSPLRARREIGVPPATTC